jgi:hypothetical protein
VKGTYSWKYEEEDLDITGTVDFCLTPGDPGCRTFRNGDPGYPPDPPEIALYDATIMNFVVGEEIIELTKSQQKTLGKYFVDKIADEICYGIQEINLDLL